MKKFTTLTSVATPFNFDDVDTDVIYPAQHLKVIRRSGLEDFGFEAIRFNKDGSIIPDAIFNRPAYATAEILLAGRNFGCGSSREHAVWSIAAMGYRCIVAKGFGDIFYSNCIKNGLLPVVLSLEDVDRLANDFDKKPLTVDLLTQSVSADGFSKSFEIAPQHKHCLMEGLDQIAMTLDQEAGISSFEASQRDACPWLY
jgi:3-isopropylmalate/(R)-2-methylmalate dehydratase small subunit